jgi:hypothetical protein
MRVAKLVVALPHPNGGDFPSQPAVPIKENMKVVITRSGKTMAEPKVKSKKMGPTDPVKEEEKAEAEVEAKPRPEKEEENLGKASPKDISDTHLLPVPHQVKKPVEDEKFNRFMEVIQRIYIHILGKSSGYGSGSNSGKVSGSDLGKESGILRQESG